MGSGNVSRKVFSGGNISVSLLVHLCFEEIADRDFSSLAAMRAKCWEVMQMRFLDPKSVTDTEISSKKVFSCPSSCTHSFLDSHREKIQSRLV